MVPEFNHKTILDLNYNYCSFGLFRKVIGAVTPTTPPLFQMHPEIKKAMLLFCHQNLADISVERVHEELCVNITHIGLNWIKSLLILNIMMLILIHPLCIMIVCQVLKNTNYLNRQSLQGSLDKTPYLLARRLETII